MFFFSIFLVIRKISNFNMWTAKNLAQASCTELTLIWLQSFYGIFFQYCFLKKILCRLSNLLKFCYQLLFRRYESIQKFYYYLIFSGNTRVIRQKMRLINILHPSANFPQCILLDSSSSECKVEPVQNLNIK